MSSLDWKIGLLNVGGITYFFTLSLGALVIGTLVTLPDLYANDPQALYRCRLAAVAVFVILLLNWCCLVCFHRHSAVQSSPSTPLPKFAAEDGVSSHRTCMTCVTVCPPRAKHCPLCNVCVMKRDHHCFFGGCCVGFHNQRYFIVMCLYGLIGAIYSTLATFSYLATHYANPLSYQAYCYLLPWLLYYWLLGQIETKVVALVMFGYFSVMTSLACGYYFVFQCLLLTTGQTSYEYVKGIRRYQQSLSANLRSVFGPYWALNLILPVPFLKSTDNGVDWMLAHEE